MSSAPAASARSSPFSFGTRTGYRTPGRRLRARSSSSASASCGTALGFTNDVASITVCPASARRVMSSSFVSVGSMRDSACSPSRGLTSTIWIRVTRRRRSFPSIAISEPIAEEEATRRRGRWEQEGHDEAAQRSRVVRPLRDLDHGMLQREAGGHRCCETLAVRLREKLPHACELLLLECADDDVAVPHHVEKQRGRDDEYRDVRGGESDAKIDRHARGEEEQLAHGDGDHERGRDGVREARDRSQRREVEDRELQRIAVQLRERARAAHDLVENDAEQREHEADGGDAI